MSLFEYTLLNSLYSGQTSICARFNLISTILTLSVSLTDWGHPEYGCPDHSDKVKDPNPETPDDPCGGDSYKYEEYRDPVPVPWDWFHCVKSGKCIHPSGRCDMIPNPACIFENKTTGETIVEDEDGCDYISKGLTSNSATLDCPSKSHNKNSSAVLSTFFNWTLKNSGSSWEDSYQYKLQVIPAGTIVNIKATSCDGVIECFDDSDEPWCGKMELYETILIGKNLLTLSAFFCFIFHVFLM